MTALSDIPLNAYCWGLGAVTIGVLGVKSVMGYYKTRGQLSKYMIWFSVVFFVALMAFSLPAFFTLDHGILRTTYLIGEFFFWAGLVTQAAILWCLILRQYFSVYYAVVPVAITALGCWLYDVSRARLSLEQGFINYYDPLITTFVIAMLVIILFVPVGIYFMRAASHQRSVKATATSFVLGMMYAGIGLSLASEEVISGQIVTPASAVVNIIISAMLLTSLLLPWRLSVKLPEQVQAPVSPKPM